MSRKSDAGAPVTRRVSASVREFLDAGRESLSLELLAGGTGLDRAICEPAMNRPGLALTGFFQYFAHRRVQIMGHAELAFLASLPEAEREKRLRDVFARNIPCLVVTRKRKPLPEVLRLGDERGIPVLGSPLITMYFINTATILMERLMAPRMVVQGTMVEIQGIGTLIEGDAGVGKSETALALVRRGYSLVSDDVTSLRLDSSGAIVGSASGVTRYHMDIRGLGIIHVPSLFGVGSVRGEKQLDLIITLSRRNAVELSDPFDDTQQRRQVLGVDIPHVTLPVVAGRDLGNLVEAAALDQKLKRLGHDAAKELDEKLKDRLSGAG